MDGRIDIKTSEAAGGRKAEAQRPAGQRRAREARRGGKWMLRLASVASLRAPGCRGRAEMAAGAPVPGALQTRSPWLRGLLCCMWELPLEVPEDQ